MTTLNASANNLHIICKRSKPPPSTADAACIAINDVTQERFLCKDNKKVPWLPLAEWIAQNLARKCGVLVPDCFIVELEADPDVKMFGSRWEGGAESYSSGIIGKITNPKEFSAIYAFDLLIHNVDRHLNNYLYLQLHTDTVVKAMDHSRCLWQSGWPIPNPPMEFSSNTMMAKNTWKSEAGWDKAVAISVTEKWKLISKTDIENIVITLPPAWLSNGEQKDLLDWWGSEDWKTRVELVIGELS